MGLDSATPGRMAITFYRELKGSEFLDRVERWHEQYAWAQNFGKNTKFVGAPASRDIAEAAYGMRLDDKLRKATVERLLPCIIDGQAVPIDLVLSTGRRASNRIGLDHWEWEKCLGIACALFRGYSKSQGKDYQMALEEDRTTRDYLYGRLLAVADNIEGFALRQADEKRDTTAARLDAALRRPPLSRHGATSNLALTPSKSRLKASEKGAGFLWKREKTARRNSMPQFQSPTISSDDRAFVCGVSARLPLASGWSCCPSPIRLANRRPSIERMNSGELTSMTTLQNKIDFAIVFRVTHANPNGDPLNGNRPRTDYGGFGEMTDVCIKRKIRDRLLEAGSRASSFSRHDRKTDGETSSQESRRIRNERFG
jgi:hypothetical protein